MRGQGPVNEKRGADMCVESGYLRVGMPESRAVAARNSNASTKSFVSVSSSRNSPAVFSFIFVRFTFNSSINSEQISCSIENARPKAL